MYNTINSFEKFTLIIGMFMIVGCATNRPLPSATISPYQLSDTLISAHKGNIKGLIDAWIKTKPGIPIRFTTEAEAQAAELAILNGFTRFCSASGGKITQNKQYGSVEIKGMACESDNSSFIGAINPWANNIILAYDYVSPEILEKRKLKKELLTSREQKNGPSGWIQMNDNSKQKFLRFGDLTKAHVIDVNIKSEKTPIEDVSEIDFTSGRTTKKDGKVLEGKPYLESSVNSTKMSFGVALVVIDPATGEPYARYFDQGSPELAKISIDQTQDSWREKANSAIRSRFVVDTKKTMNTLTKDAENLAILATKKGWLNAIPEEKEIPKKLMRNILNDLKSLSNSYPKEECGEKNASVYNGRVYSDLNKAAKCILASKELKQIENGYAITPSTTPIAYATLIEQLQLATRLAN